MAQYALALAAIKTKLHVASFLWRIPFQLQHYFHTRLLTIKGKEEKTDKTFTTWCFRALVPFLFGLFCLESYAVVVEKARASRGSRPPPPSPPIKFSPHRGSRDRCCRDISGFLIAYIIEGGVAHELLFFCAVQGKVRAMAGPGSGDRWKTR